MLNRRAVIGGLAACTAAAGVPAAGKSRMAAPGGWLLPIRGTRLWVDDSGPRDAPALVYIHGGPGVGALDFETYVKPVLAGRMRLISMDQRGALRSDAVSGNAVVSIADIVADVEAVRRSLGIARWQVLGHSFGGTIALRYALAHPDRVTRLALENPAYDVASSSRWLAAASAQALNGVEPAAALTAVRLADPATPVDAGYLERLGAAMAKLGPRRQDLYVVQPQHRDIFSRLAETTGLPDARWRQGEAAGQAVLRSPDFYTPTLALVARVKAPILYVRGAGDRVTSPAEIAALLAAGARMMTVEKAGHFVHVEAPMEIADILAG